MKTKSIIPATILLFGLFGVRSNVNAAAPQDSKSPASVQKASEKPESFLKKGMTAVMVVKIMGKPGLVRPMKAPDGKAEIWEYHRQIDEHFSHVQVGSKPIMVDVQEGDGQIHHYQSGETPVFSDVRYYTEETIQLLMFDDRFLVAKVSSQKMKTMI
ncbi:MAG TPA: hypothetical protein VGM64_03920 [Lacunisphaera sp.]|jgi:hypothetical protein